MTTKSISEVLKEASSHRKITERVQTLLDNNSDVLQGVLKVAFDTRIEFDLPEGAPPFKPSEALDNHSVFQREWAKLYMFLKNGYPGLNQVKREQLFIQLLEACTPDDANLMVAIKDHKMPYEGITEKVVELAYPGLLNG